MNYIIITYKPNSKNTYLTIAIAPGKKQCFYCSLHVKIQKLQKI